MKSLSVTTRIAIAFCVLVALLVAVGNLALNGTQKVNDDLNDLVNHEWIKVQLAQQALASSTVNNRITMQVFLTTDVAAIEPLLKQRARNTENISGLVQKIEQYVESEEERKLLAEVKAARSPYIESYKHAIKLQLDEKKHEEALIILVKTTLPLLIRYHAAWNSFVQFQGEQMNQAAQKARARYASIREQMVTLIILAVFFATAIMAFVTRKTATETAERRRAEESLRRAYDELEERIQLRTVELTRANEAMRIEIAERQKAEAARLEAQAEREAVEAQLRQAQKMEAIGQLAAGIAHEINTPVQFVGDNAHFVQESFKTIEEIYSLFAEMTQAAKKGSLIPELVEKIEKAIEISDIEYLFKEVPIAVSHALEGVERITQLVLAMKEFSHPGSKEKVAVDLNEAIKSTVLVARNEWKYVADMQLDLDPDLPRVVCFVGDFNQALLNLIVNASHAIGDVVMRDGTSKGVIAISSQQVGETVEVRVSDTGSGIPEEIRDRIFEPFFTTKDVGKGTGQGLSVVYASIVKRHGGTVTFQSELGKGTTFTLRFPIAPSETCPTFAAELTATF